MIAPVNFEEFNDMTYAIAIIPTENTLKEIAKYTQKKNTKNNYLDFQSMNSSSDDYPTFIAGLQLYYNRDFFKGEIIEFQKMEHSVISIDELYKFKKDYFNFYKNDRKKSIGTDLTNKNYFLFKEKEKITINIITESDEDISILLNEIIKNIDKLGDNKIKTCFMKIVKYIEFSNTTLKFKTPVSELKTDVKKRKK